MDVRTRLQKNLRRLREQKGWSQEELADQAGLHRTYVSGIERRLRNPTLEVLDRVAVALQVSIGELTDLQL